MILSLKLFFARYFIFWVMMLFFLRCNIYIMFKNENTPWYGMFSKRIGMKTKCRTFLKILILNLCAYLVFNLSIAIFFYANPVYGFKKYKYGSWWTWCFNISFVDSNVNKNLINWWSDSNLIGKLICNNSTYNLFYLFVIGIIFICYFYYLITFM